MSSPGILIVGAGPTGLTLAIELARRGVPFRLVDQRTKRHGQSRATDIQARTLEIFDDMGVIGAFLEAGQWRSRFSIHANGAQSVVRVDGADSPYPTMLGLRQDESEALLEAHLQALGGQVAWGVRFATLRQHSDGVDAVLLHPDGRWEEPRFRWVVGCDGAHSAVRVAVRGTFEGHTFPDRWFLADLRMAWPPGPEEVGILFNPPSALIVLTLPQGWVRVFGIATPEIEAAWGEDGLSPEQHGALVSTALGTPVQVDALGWSTRFTAHTRMVDRYRFGRVFLAGDAAHIHSPIGGHGMNLCIQDAYNLGWKLGLVERGEAPEALLDSYPVERMPLARSLLKETDLQHRGGSMTHPLAIRLFGVMSQGMFSLLDQVPAARDAFFRHAMQLDMDYLDSPWVGEARHALPGHLTASDQDEAPSWAEWRAFAAGPRPGTRAVDLPLPHHPAGSFFGVLRGTTFLLVLFDGHAPTEAGYRGMAAVAAEVRERWPARVRVVMVSPSAGAVDALPDEPVILDPGGALHRRYGAESEALYLFRPDGYIGFRSQPIQAEPLRAHLELVLGRDTDPP